MLDKILKTQMVRKDLIIMENKCESNVCISCDVKNCMYHAANNTCSAGKIHVGNGMASNAQETCCDTFKAK